MSEIDDMRAVIEASIIADSRHGEKMRALDALYALHARAEAGEAAAEAALAKARVEGAATERALIVAKVTAKIRSIVETTHSWAVERALDRLIIWIENGGPAEGRGPGG